MADEPALRARAAALCREEQTLARRKELCIGQQRASRREAAVGHGVALLILCLESGSEAAARVFLQRHFGSRSAQAHEVLAAAKRERSAMEPYEVEAMVGIGGDTNGAMLRRAQRFLSDFQLHSWVEQQNLSKGIAPVASVVHMRRAGLACGASSPVKSSISKSGKQWLRRWRRRWGVQLGRIAAREHLTVQDQKKEATVFESSW